MATQTPQQKHAEDHRLTQAAIAAAFIAALRALWPSLIPRDMLDSSPLFKARLYEAVAEFAEASIEATTLRYELMRDDAGILDRLRLPLVELPVRERVDLEFDVATTNLWQPAATEKAFLDAVASDAEFQLSEALADTVVDAGRREMDAAIGIDRQATRFAREVKPGCCFFCALLSTRGAVYASAESAGEVKRYHPGCRCQIVPVFGVYEMSAQAREAKALYDRVTANASGRNKMNAFRRAWERDRDGELAEASASSDTGTAKRTPTAGFDSLSLDQIEQQIDVIEPLKDSDWKSKQLDRLRQRAAELRTAA